MHEQHLPDPIEERPITLGVWLLGGAVVLLLLALML